MISSLPTCFLSLCHPGFDGQFYRKIQREFLIYLFFWGEGSNYHVVAWDKVCKLEHVGGVDIRHISLMNKTLLSKCLGL